MIGRYEPWMIPAAPTPRLCTVPFVATRDCLTATCPETGEVIAVSSLHVPCAPYAVHYHLDEPLPEPEPEPQLDDDRLTDDGLTHATPAVSLDVSRRFGIAAVALCGRVWHPQEQVGEDDPRPKCPTCFRRYLALPADPEPEPEPEPEPRHVTDHQPAVAHYTMQADGSVIDNRTGALFVIGQAPTRLDRARERVRDLWRRLRRRDEWHGWQSAGFTTDEPEVPPAFEVTTHLRNQATAAVDHALSAGGWNHHVAGAVLDAVAQHQTCTYCHPGPEPFDAAARLAEHLNARQHAPWMPHGRPGSAGDRA